MQLRPDRYAHLFFDERSYLGGIFIEMQAEHVFWVPREARTFAIAKEEREFSIRYDRTIDIQGENRTIDIPGG